jgi:hypothetical protein
MAIVYIAGPYRGTNDCQMHKNIMVAREAAISVWQMGAVAICPQLNTAFFGGVVPEEKFIQGYLEVVRRCDAVLLLPDWILSEGAQLERAEALGCDVPVFCDTKALRSWLVEHVYA